MKKLRSNRVLINGEITPADIKLNNGLIEQLAPYGTLKGAIDFQDHLIMPGIVDLHCDALEKELQPRPGTHLPIKNALVEMDKKMAACGVTTSFHALSFNDRAEKDIRHTKRAMDIVTHLYEANKNYLKVDNLTHVRFDIHSLTSIPSIKELIETNQIKLLSLMDHTPGQGQWKDLEKWKIYIQDKLALDDESLQSLYHDTKSHQQQMQEQSAKILPSLLELAKQHGIQILSHDDDEESKVDYYHMMGVRICEYPLDIPIAKYAREKGMATGMGAPNIVRGGSQSGNVDAIDMIKAQQCDYLCSDYYPPSMLMACYKIVEDLEIKLEEVLSLITSTPAHLSGVQNVGAISEGYKADIIIVDESYAPNVVLTLKNGVIVHNSYGNI